MNEFLFRIDIACPLEDLLVCVADEYHLGAIRSHDILPNGYQELNVLLVTTAGRFVVKIFSKEKTLQRVQDNVWGYLTFRKDGVSMPTLRKTSHEKYIFSTEGKRRTTHLIVMDYFEGSYLYPNQATDSDVASLAQHMTIIHTHTKRIHRYYDTMGIVNVVSQYKKFKHYLSPNLLNLIQPVINEFSDINLGNFRHSIIHGTFEPKNILKNTNGDLCFLDLGCMDYNASIVDIATFLANYTIDMNGKDKQKRIDLILNAYQTQNSLSVNELRSIPILVRAQYATIVVRTNYYIRKKHDTTSQTQNWLAFGRRGLIQMVK